MQPVSTIDILTPAVRIADATGQHTIDLARVLKGNGATVNIIYNDSTELVPEDLRPSIKNINANTFLSGAALAILQYPIWYPLAERFRYSRNAALFWYHGVTPPQLWSEKQGAEELHASEKKTRLAWHADLAVCASPFTAAELHRHSGYPQDRIRIIPYAVNTSHLEHRSASSESDSLRNQLRLTGKRVLLYVGRIAGHKRIDLLIAALAKLASYNPDLCLLIVGNPNATQTTKDLTAQLRSQAQALGIAERVIFAGEAFNVAPYYELADIFVQASQHEGFCVPLIESMAAGVPIVASASSAMPWVLNAQSDEDYAGLTFVPGDADSLAQQVERLLNNPQLCNDLVLRGKQRMQEFDHAHFEQRVNDVVAEVTEMKAQKLVKVDFTNLQAQADTVIRGYKVRSGVPLLGKWIAKFRVNSTSHIKEAYLDRVLDRQVDYNNMLANEIDRLHAEISLLRAQLDAIKDKI